MSKIYTQRFRDKWLIDPRYSKWLQRLEGNDTRCFCTYCLCILVAKINDIEKHRLSKKHQKSEIFGTPQDKVQPKRIEDKVQIRDMKKEKSTDSETLEVETQNESEVYEIEFPTDQYLVNSSIKTPGKKRARTPKPVLLMKQPNFNQDSMEPPHEIDVYVTSLAAQMKMLPEKHVLDLFSELQNVVTRKRQKVLEEKAAQRHASLSNTQVITVTMPTNEEVSSMPSLSENEL